MSGAADSSTVWTPLGRGTLALLLGSMRVREEGTGALRRVLDAGLPAVVVFWHGSMLAPWWMLRRRDAACLVSRSRDGQILADILAGWGYEPLRGSSSRGGADAMEEMRRALRGGRLLCVTPDGPRGPRHAMKMGAVRVAQTEGVPLFCVAAAYRRCRRLRSWDAFEVPWPFTRVALVADEARAIDPSLAGADLDAERGRVQDALGALHDRAARLAEE